MHLPDLTAKRADLDGDKVALVDLASGADITYADLDNRASRVAEFLRNEWGVGRAIGSRPSRITVLKPWSCCSPAPNCTR